jgi:hypothetical protein
VELDQHDIAGPQPIRSRAEGGWHADAEDRQRTDEGVGTDPGSAERVLVGTNLTDHGSTVILPAEVRRGCASDNSALALYEILV